MSWWAGLNRQLAELQARLTGNSRISGRSELVGGRNLTEWENGWRRIGLLTSAHVTAPQETIGLFRLRQGGEIVYLGRSDNANCLRRTLRALIHGGRSTGTVLDRQLPERASELTVEILITGSDNFAGQLETRWLRQDPPAWNQLQLDGLPAASGRGARTESRLG